MGDRRISARVLLAICLVGASWAGDGDVALSQTTGDLRNPPPDAVFVPADYDGDGLMDFAVKGSNGIWYIDVAKCSKLHKPETETDCSNYVDDDNDGLVNDGCPAVGRAEPKYAPWACDAPYGTAGDNDEDPTTSADDEHIDGYFNDGCDANRQCMGRDGFGGRWDFVYFNYGDADAIPVPADYGTMYNGPADGRADLSTKSADGFWGIDYADNGFGTWDLIFPSGYGDANAEPWPADYDGDGKADLSVRVTTGSGAWYFDYSSDGFGSWNIPCSGGCPCTVQPGVGYPKLGYGGGLDTPAVGDFDGDGCADLSVKTQSGDWFFDLAANGFNGWEAPCPDCDVPLRFYGDHTHRPVVANFDPNFDAKTDLAVQTPDGHWAIDFAADGFGTWNTFPFYNAGWGGGSAKFVPGHFATTGGNLDMAVKDPFGTLYLDEASDGYGNANQMYTTSRVLVDTSRAWIDSVSISADVPPVAGCGNGRCTGLESCSTCPEDCDPCSSTVNGGNYYELPVDPLMLKIGVRYTANVHLQPSDACNSCADDDSDGFPNDGCPPKGRGENPGQCYGAVDDDEDTRINDGCLAVGAAEAACMDDADNDQDGLVNDGCPALGAAEAIGQCRNFVDDDNDGVFNDGCPEVLLGEPDYGSVRVNPDLRVPATLNVANIGGHTVQNTASPVVYPHTRRLAFTCSHFGTYPLGFMFSALHTSDATNVDYGQNVTCTADHTGIYGFVTSKRTGATISGTSDSGTSGAIVKVNGISVPVDDAGFWNASTLTGGPHKVEVTAPGFAPATAVNVRVPPFGSPAGVQVDTPLEESFVLQTGLTYTTYIDYSRGRTILHTVRIDATRAPITLGRVPIDANGSEFKPLKNHARDTGAPVMINGIWWMVPEPQTVAKLTGNECELRAGEADATMTRAIGYLYINGIVSPPKCENGVCRPSDPECATAKFYAAPVPNRLAAAPVLLQDAWQLPLFGVKGTGTQQRVSIVMADANFLTSNNDWKRVSGVPGCPSGSVCPIYDAVRPFNSSDYNYAMQMGHILLKDGVVKDGVVMARGILAEIGTTFPGEFALARTTIGTSEDGTVAWFVIADGEGIDGGHGVTSNQIGEFYRDVLGANAAMFLDSGESTEMVLRGLGGQHRRVNTLTSENHAADGIGPNGDYAPSGRVFTYIRAGM